MNLQFYQMLLKKKEAIELYEKSGRIDLSSKENEELLIIQQYLPKQLSDSEIEVIISKILTENNIAVQKISEKQWELH